MNWVKFISWLTGLYLLYYLLNIAWDMIRSKKAGSTDQSPVLHFEEQAATQKIEAEAEQAPVPKSPGAKVESAASAIGGVNLKDLFNLAKAEVIVYNRAVSF